MATDVLASILARKQSELVRRARHTRGPWPAPGVPSDERALASYRALSRGDAPLPRVIAEIKHRSPSAGVIRPRTVGGVAAIAGGYQNGGAAAVSVLCDGPGFGGTPLDVRRAARAVSIPILFKEFVLAEAQLDLAFACGASMVLLLVRAMSGDRLRALVDAVHARGLAPVVEAADAEELSVALSTSARIVGVNARDLRTFHVDDSAASTLVEQIPSDRIAVYMSGVRSGAALRALADSRADAVLVGEGLMRAPDPGAELGRWLAS
jgi:indole-3-glycerol phosphate synthase